MSEQKPRYDKTVQKEIELGKKYIESSGCACPFCGYERISALGDFNPDSGDSCSRKIECEGCGKVFWEIYKISGIALMNE